METISPPEIQREQGEVGVIEPPLPPTAATSLKGTFFGVLAALFYSLSSIIATKYLAADPILLSAWRFVATIPISIFFYGLSLCGNKVDSKDKSFRTSGTFYSGKISLLIFLQCLLWTNSTVLFYFGIKNLSYSDCVSITAVSPIFVTILTILIERSFSGCKIMPGISLFLTIAGVVIVSKPPILTGDLPSSGHSWVGICWSLGSMLFISFSTVLIKQLDEVNTAFIMVSVSLWGAFQTVLMAYFMGNFGMPQSLEQVTWIFLVAGLSYMARFCTALASKYEAPEVVSLTRIMEVPISFFLQAMFLDKPLDIYSVIGASLTVLAVGLNAGTKVVSGMADENPWKTRLSWLLL